MSPRPNAVIFDLDGVVRDWNDDDMFELESSYGLPPGTILGVGFGSELGPLATTGRLTYRAWMDEIRARVTAAFGDDVTPALDRWEANIGVVDTQMLSVLRQVRMCCTAAVLSNGTTRLRRDLHALDLIDEFDLIFNTAEIGIAKPDPAVFHHVLDEMGLAVERVVFVDDLPENVASARSVGMCAHLHTDATSTLEFLRETGLALR